MVNAYNPIRGKNSKLLGGAGFNALAAGRKAYGQGGRPFPNVGAVGAEAKKGYAKRDAKRDDILRRKKRNA